MAHGARTAAIFGATGVVGSQCLRQLLDNPGYGRVIAIGRRPTGFSHPKLTERQVSLDKLGTLSREAWNIDDAFCCLGTTQAKAGSAQAFRQVDCEFPRAAARFAKANGARQFLLITAIGANAKSPILYNKVKGEAEAAVIAEGLESTAIFRPSLLLGEREEFRWKEKLSEPFMRLLSLVMIGPARALRPIEAGTVARAMIRVAELSKPGVTIYPSDKIADLGNS